MKTWTEEQLNTLKRLWNQGMLAADIARTLGKTTASVHLVATRKREELGLVMRNRHHRSSMPRLGSNAPTSKLDREWAGVVPLKHWTITQKWSRG